MRYILHPRTSRRFATISALVALGWAWSLGAVAQADEPLRYNRDIRPILAENCFRCHGPDSASRQADLRIDQFEGATASGAIVPEQPDASEMIRRIRSTDPDAIMPPPSSHKQLTAQQIETLTRWVAQGAPYERHWSLIPPVRPQPPAVTDAAWVRNPIDQFVLARLEQEGLQPAPEADRYVLARRLSLDLTGLPPDPVDVEAFVHDPAPDAYERYVARLLESPAWGEHRGRYWLDAARYADSHGIHFDNYREMWAYRAWVIEAFNRNLPYDQFSLEQLAGDLLPNATLDQQIASGFNRCNITTNEGGVIPEEYLVLYARDRTETTATVWLGTTAGCTVCHDHKFDRWAQREFYELAAFFNNTTQGAMDGNVPNTPPIIRVPQADDRARSAQVQTELAAAELQVAARRDAARSQFDAWLAAPESLGQATAGIPVAGLVFAAPLNEGAGADVHLQLGDQPLVVAGSGPLGWAAGQVAPQALQLAPGATVVVPEVGDFERDQPFTVAAWIKLPDPNGGGAILAKMDEAQNYRGWDLWVEGGRVGMHLVNAWPQDALKVVSSNPLPANAWAHVLVSYDGSSKAAGLQIYVNGQPQPTQVLADALQNTIRSSVPWQLAQRHSSARIDNLLIQDVRFYGRNLDANEAAALARETRLAGLLARPAEQRSPAETDELYQWWLTTGDAEYAALSAQVAALTAERDAIYARGTIAHVMQEKPEAAMAYVLFRGEYDKRRDEVQPKTPEMLPPMPAELPRNRLGLAQWLFLPEQPLTARVAVNRFWQEVFGTGIVRTSGDFGVAGELPVHPELLDWLAVEFRESGWDVKRLFTLIVSSATYRQAAVATPEKIERDPQNLLLSRGPRFRMDAEVIRDYALAASGLLVRKIGGPSVKPYQPPGVWEAVAMIGSNTRDYVRDTGEGLYRRSMYTFWKRSAPPAQMDIFNAPSRETCTVRRERTDTPLQALVTLNDEQFVEAARRLAELALLSGGETTGGRIDALARRVLLRPLSDVERSIIEGSLAELTAYYAADPADAAALIDVGESIPDPTLDAATLAAWTMLANELLNLDEVLNK